MHLSTLLLSLLLPLAQSAIQQPPLSTATLYHAPASSTAAPSSPKQLAVLTYLPDRPYISHIVSLTPPANVSISSAKSDLTQVISYLPNGKEWRSSVTATVGFHAPARGRFRLVVSKEGEVLGASWKSWLPRDGNAAESSERKDRRKERGEFDLVMQKRPAGVVFDKPKTNARPAGAGAGVEGGEEEVVEKTMFQKYWWVLVAGGAVGYDWWWRG